MPLPKPDKNESRDKYISRCMKAQKGENKKRAQKLAICFSKWRRKNEG